MKNSIHFKIFPATNLLPENWDYLAQENIFLSKNYLQVLEKSAPENMSCHFIGLFKDEKLVGIALSQFLNLNLLQSFGERDKCLKTSVRNFIFKNFSSHVLFIGNNMLTGQNAFYFSPEINFQEALKSLKKASEALKDIYKNKGLKIHLTSFKDFSEEEITSFEKATFDGYYKFSTQPNMVFEIKENWKNFDDYVADLSKKYRDQFKRSRKKSEGITKQKMDLDAIIKHEKTIYDLYFHVAKNAPFNTFFLAKNHFRVFKELLGDKFLFYGYFIDNNLVGFNTLIKNGDSMDTYFLGYDDQIQKEKMLYLNMLYDMIGYSINQGFKEIVFARTALEIKSSVGAKPVEMFGFIQHSNSLINKKIDKIFDYLEPKTEWQERNPFKV
ncbi:8-amino-7-oxononanoate synthase [Flavobacterium qiangtangense]|uniref:8-amino-7-oxononanoate synthase n=1 Tax=Flavobacterium qiangtangense TaxID=1442595 RepID=A0ABW1PMS6_9FLAO